MPVPQAGWTIISGVSAAAIVGVTGLALATGGGGEDDALPASISLEDPVPITQAIDVPPSFNLISPPIIAVDADASPLDVAAFEAEPGVSISLDSPEVVANEGISDEDASPDGDDTAAPVTDISIDATVSAASLAPSSATASELDSATSFDTADAT
jgi:hypothetical protein